MFTLLGQSRNGVDIWRENKVEHFQTSVRQKLDFKNIIAWRTLVTAVVCDNSIIQQAFSIITLTIDFLPFKVSSFDYFEAI